METARHRVFKFIQGQLELLRAKTWWIFQVAGSIVLFSENLHHINDFWSRTAMDEWNAFAFYASWYLAVYEFTILRRAMPCLSNTNTCPHISLLILSLIHI